MGWVGQRKRVMGIVQTLCPNLSRDDEMSYVKIILFVLMGPDLTLDSYWCKFHSASACMRLLMQGNFQRLGFASNHLIGGRKACCS